MLILRSNRIVFDLYRAMGSGFNCTCNLDITRSFHQITNYLSVYKYYYIREISLTEDGRWDST